MFGKVRLGIGSGLVLSKQIVNTCRTRLVLLALFVVAHNPYSNEWANSNKLNIILKCYWHDLLLRYILLTVFSVLWKTLTCLQQQFVTLPHKGHVLTALHVTVYLCSRVLNGFTCYLIHLTPIKMVCLSLKNGTLNCHVSSTWQEVGSGLSHARYKRSSLA